MVADWLNVTLDEVYRVNEIQYLEARRDAFIHKLNQTEGGREYLDNAWLLEQTKPDRTALRNAFN